MPRKPYCLNEISSMQLNASWSRKLRSISLQILIFILLLPMRKIEVTSSLWKDVFSSCQKRGTKKKFWVPMRNWTSDLLIVCDCMWNWVKKGVNLVNSKTTSINLVNLRKFECEEQESWRPRDQGYIDW